MKILNFHCLFFLALIEKAELEMHAKTMKYLSSIPIHEANKHKRQQKTALRPQITRSAKSALVNPFRSRIQ